MTPQELLAEAFYALIGIVFVLCGAGALRDRALPSRVPTALFWFLLAFTFILGGHLPRWVSGACLVAVGTLTAFGRIGAPRAVTPSAQDARRHAGRIGNRIFLPALVLALTGFLAATLTDVGANNAIGVASAAALLAALLVTRAPARFIAVDGERLMQGVGPVGILPQVLAALGALFTAAGVGDVIAGGIAGILPAGSRILGVAAYCTGMAVFTVLMGNGFAAFSVITAGIGVPFVIALGGNPAVVGALGLTAGYCGTLVTPMAANFNIMPAAILGTGSKYAVIRYQAPMAAALLLLHIALMYFFAF